MVENNVSVSWTDIVAAVVVVYSAILSTITFIRQIQESKPKVKVKASYGYYLQTTYSNPKIIGEFINIGKIPIKVSDIEINISKRKKGKKLVFTKHNYIQLPVMVQPGDSITTELDILDIKNTIEKSGIKMRKKYRIRFKDVAGNKYYSNKFKLI